MTVRDQIIERWSGKRAALDSYPAHRGKWPDADHTDILARLCTGLVCEVGCGTGRCSEAFITQRYVGVDINAAAIKMARRLYPHTRFEAIAWSDPYPEADTYLFHTTMMHLPADEVLPALKRCSGRVVIADWMEPRLSEPGNLIWHRPPDFYVDALTQAGFRTILPWEEYPTNYQLRGSDVVLQRRFLVGEA